MDWLRVMTVLAVLAALLALLGRIRLGVLVDLGEIVAVDAAAGPLRFRIIPSRKLKREKPKKEKPKKEKKDRGTPAKKIPRPTAEDLKTAWAMLWPPLCRALERTRRGLTIRPMRLSAVLPGRDDPASAAENYGKLNAAVWAVMPRLEQWVDIPEPSIHVGLDFDADKPVFRGKLGVSMRLGTLLAIGFGMAVPALKWFLRFCKAHRQPEKQQQTAAAPAEKEG